MNVKMKCTLAFATVLLGIVTSAGVASAGVIVEQGTGATADGVIVEQSTGDE
ncbi:hypothetical protein [Streptomyces sp. NPDC053431]|uniref:hypothetical protein n=1 Tax=Streptomyces sp. NPDC053431 TaxID=3365703 RepID=UPI0037D27011